MATLQEAWNVFQEGLKSVLRQWTILKLAQENNWGGGDSSRKVILLQEELLTMFRTQKQLYRDQVEDFLQDYLEDSFSTIAEDGSPAEVAALLTDMFHQCGQRDFTLANNARQREESLARLPAPVKSMSGGGSDSSSSDDDDGTESDDEGGGGDGKRLGGQRGGGMGGGRGGGVGREPPSAGAVASPGDSGMDVEGEDDGGGAGAAAADAAGPVVDPDGWETVGSKRGKGWRRGR